MNFKSIAMIFGVFVCLFLVGCSNFESSKGQEDISAILFGITDIDQRNYQSYVEGLGSQDNVTVLNDSTNLSIGLNDSNSDQSNENVQEDVLKVCGEISILDETASLSSLQAKCFVSAIKDGCLDRSILVVTDFGKINLTLEKDFDSDFCYVKYEVAENFDFSFFQIKDLSLVSKFDQINYRCMIDESGDEDDVVFLRSLFELDRQSVLSDDKRCTGTLVGVKQMDLEDDKDFAQQPRNISLDYRNVYLMFEDNVEVVDFKEKEIKIKSFLKDSYNFRLYIEDEEQENQTCKNLTNKKLELGYNTFKLEKCDLEYGDYKINLFFKYEDKEYLIEKDYEVVNSLLKDYDDVFDCGFSDVFDTSKDLNDVDLDSDEVLECLGYSLLYECQEKKGFLQTRRWGELEYSIEGDYRGCDVRVEFPSSSQIKDEDEKIYANTYAKCPISVEDLFSESKVDEFKLNHENLSEIGRMMHVYFDNFVVLGESHGCSGTMYLVDEYELSDFNINFLSNQSIEISNSALIDVLANISVETCDEVFEMELKSGTFSYDLSNCNISSGSSYGVELEILEAGILREDVVAE